MGIVAKTKNFPWPTLDMELSKLQALTQSMEDAGWTYGFGAKVNSISAQAASVGVGGRKVDCSGFTRWAIFHACTGLLVPDGSANFHSWCIATGFKPSTPDAMLLKDGAIRVAFLAPGDTPSGIGHVLFAANALTYESHGGKGPDSRAVDFSLHPFMARMHVFVLTPPSG